MASAVPAELRTAVRALQLSVQQSRPRNVVCFSLRFIHDERSDNASMGHALHALPFLLRHPDAFRSMACTVFCGTKNVQGVLCDRKGLREVVRASMASVTGCPNPSASQPPPPSSRKQSETVSAATSEDGRGDSLAVAWQLDVIEATLREHLKTLDLLDFECFVVTLRIYLSCWVVILWVMDMLAEAGGSFSELLALLKRCDTESFAHSSLQASQLTIPRLSHF